MQSLTGFDASFIDNVLYLTGQFEQTFIKGLLCDNLIVFDKDAKIVQNNPTTEIIAKNREKYITSELNQNDKFVTFLNKNEEIVTLQFDSIIQKQYSNFSITSKSGQIPLRLEFRDRLFYEIISNLNNDNNLIQTIILTSKLPYILKELTNLKISFQNQEVKSPRYESTRSLMKTSGSPTNVSASFSDDIGLPIDLGEIKEFDPLTKLHISLEPVKLIKQKEQFTYTIGDLYCYLETYFKIEEGNIYPSSLSINDEQNLPVLFTNITLQELLLKLKEIKLQLI
jgi:hypothetical protein